MAYCCVPFYKSQSGKSNVSFHGFRSKENLRITTISEMKKPKFDQLRGTPAQKLRNRICWGATLVTTVVSGLCMMGLLEIAPPRITKLKLPEEVQEPVFKRRSLEILQKANEVYPEE